MSRLTEYVDASFYVCEFSLSVKRVELIVAIPTTANRSRTRFTLHRFLLVVPPAHPLVPSDSRSSRNRMHRIHARSLLREHESFRRRNLFGSRLIRNDGSTRDRRQTFLVGRQWNVGPRVLQQLVVGVGDRAVRFAVGRDLGRVGYVVGRWGGSCCVQYFHDWCCSDCESDSIASETEYS